MNQRYQQQRRALGSEAVITLVAAVGDPRVKAIFERAWEMVEDFEQRFSRFLPSSELSWLNQSDGARAPATPAMQRVAQTARDYAERSDGLFSPLLLGELQRAGYVGSFGVLDPAADIDLRDRGVQAAADIEIGDDWVMIPAGSALDFGGIGKGYLLDQLGDYLAGHGVADFWLSLGGDMLVDGHDLGSTDGWSIAVADAADPAADAARLTSGGRHLAAATSGTVKRRGARPDGAAWHHIIDPRTGRPAETDVLTATVVAPSATAADVWAKCLVIGGSAAAKTFAAGHGITDAYLQLSSKPRRLSIGKLITKA
jgi:thiamine biosynthesis lipoprotein